MIRVSCVRQQALYLIKNRDRSFLYGIAYLYTIKYESAVIINLLHEVIHDSVHPFYLPFRQSGMQTTGKR